jgi:outer membrane protein OmpA-like peptidoglycan-associated protein
MTTQEKLVNRKLRIIELAEFLKNVSQACRINGVSRQHFYDIKKAYDEHGIQTQRQKYAKAYEVRLDSPNVIFFKQNSNELSDPAIVKLERICDILTNNFEAELVLNSYSDSIGAPAYNQMISEIRANAVKSFLVGKGIQPSRIMALGHGAQKFIASNKTTEGRRMNRRVEIELITP